MVKENYYELLGLEPSEDNPQIIEARINEMEKKWKDLAIKLNKAEHKRLVELIPDIRKRMMNPESRRTEAQAAIIAGAINPTKHEAARKSLSESYSHIEDMLNHFEYIDIYDFLSRNPANNSKIGRYNFDDSGNALIERAKELMEAYRNLADSADKMRLASIVADFFGNDRKDVYDRYIILDVKMKLADEVDTVVKYSGNAMDANVVAKLTSAFTRLNMSPLIEH